MTKRNPALAALARAPLDDEPETPRERRAVEAARRAMARGELVPHAEAMSSVGRPARDPTDRATIPRAWRARPSDVAALERIAARLGTTQGEAIRIAIGKLHAELFAEAAKASL